MNATRPSRIENARRRLRTARIAVAAGSVALFGGVALAARVSHAASSSSPQPADATVDDDAGPSYDFGFGDGSIGPSDGATPSLQSSSS